MLVLAGAIAAPVTLQEETGVGFFTRDDQSDSSKPFGREPETREFLKAVGGKVGKKGSWECAGDVRAGMSRGARSHTLSLTFAVDCSSLYPSLTHRHTPHTSFSPSSYATTQAVVLVFHLADLYRKGRRQTRLR